MKYFSNKRILSVLFLLVTIIISETVKAQSLTWIGTLGGETSLALGLNNDGSVVVGESDDVFGDLKAFIWTPSTGIQNLNTLQNIKSWAYDVSPDGIIIIGTGHVSTFNYQAFKWTSNNGVQFLGTLGGSGSSNNSEGTSCTPDGSVIVGRAANTSNNQRAFKWTTSNGMQDLGVLTGGSFSSAYDISEDGSVIIGFASDNSGYSKPCFWLNGSIQELYTTLPTSAELGEATGISSNGNYISGWIQDSVTFDNEHGYLWIGSSSFVGIDIGLFPGVPLEQASSRAFDVSDFGQVVGEATDQFGDYSAFYWYLGVIEDLNITYSWLISSGSRLTSARAISTDGRFIVGEGFNIETNQNEAFILDRGSSTTVKTESGVPANFSLQQNYPNPFNPSTTISFSIPNEELVSLKVFNSLGEEVAELINETKPAGNYSVIFNAGELTSGIYFYTITAGSFVQTRKMILVK